MQGGDYLYEGIFVPVPEGERQTTPVPSSSGWTVDPTFPLVRPYEIGRYTLLLLVNKYIHT